MERNPVMRVPELQAQLKAGPSVAPLLLDIRFALGRDDGYERYLQGHLPGAVYLDLDTDLSGSVAPDGAGGRHPMPRVEDFETAMARVGVDGSRSVVCYDDDGMLGAARAWWLLRHFGKYDVYVLDGGLAAWRAARLPVESGDQNDVEEGDFTVRRGHIGVLDADKAALYADQGLLVDGRPADRFRGENETIDARAGHIPGAVSVPARSLLAEDGRFLPKDELRSRLELAGIDGERPVGVYCGSGVQAAMVALAIAAADLGHDTPVYVGSWSDWISDPSRPVETGPGGAASLPVTPDTEINA